METTRLDDLIIGYAEGSLSAEDRAELTRLCQDDPQVLDRLAEEAQSAALIRELLHGGDPRAARQRALRSIKELEQTSSPRELGAWVVSSLKKDPATCRRPLRRPRSRRTSLLPFLAAAASVLLLVGAYLALKPTPQNPGHVATLTEVVGACVLTRATGGETARVGAALSPGEKLTTAAQASVTLRYADGTTVRLQGNSEYALLTAASGKPGELLLGVVEADVAAQPEGAPFSIRTPHGQVTVHGTRFTLTAETEATKLQVSEGKVEIVTANASSRALVSAGGKAEMRAEGVSLRFVPIADAYIQNNATQNDKTLRVEDKEFYRVSYLQFRLSGIGTATVRSAKLRLRVTNDPGAGTLRAFRAEHSNWTEESLTRKNAPRDGEEVGSFTGRMSNGHQVNVDVTPLIAGDGDVTAVLRLKKDCNDVWFSSREGTHPPELVVTLGTDKAQ